MTTGSDDIELLLSGKVRSAGEAGRSLVTDQWQEEGPWLLLLLLPLAAFAFRRGLVICVLFALVPSTEPANALAWDDLWLNSNQQGQKKLDEGLPADAASLFEEPKWAAVSDYRAGNYASSAAIFAEDEDADSLYNLGNALARAGKYAPAIDAYNEALEMSPNDEDTLYNRDLVQELLQQQEQQQNEQEGGQQSDSESGGDSKQSDNQSQDGSSGDVDSESAQNDSASSDEETSQDDMQAMQEELQRAAEEAERRAGEESEPQQMSQAEAEARRQAQEQTQAMEQWLRRVENDPGGLLRRKFRYQYQRQGRDQDGNSVWPDNEVEPW